MGIINLWSRGLFRHSGEVTGGMCTKSCSIVQFLSIELFSYGADYFWSKWIIPYQAKKMTWVMSVMSVCVCKYECFLSLKRDLSSCADGKLFQALSTKTFVLAAELVFTTNNLSQPASVFPQLVDNLQCLTHLFSAIHFPLSISSFPPFQHFKRWPTSYTLARSVPWSQAEGN